MHEVLDYAKLRGSWVRGVSAALWRIRRFLVAGGIALFLYTGSYVGLSIFGIYEPAAIGLNYVMCYSWAPAGYVRDYKWNRFLFWFYLPMYELDRRFWHEDGGYYGGRYPVHTPTNVEDVARAWR
jgi:hypothetical protein